MVRRVILSGVSLAVSLALISTLSARPAFGESDMVPGGNEPLVNKTIVIVKPDARGASERRMPPARFLVPLTSQPRPLTAQAADPQDATKSSAGPLSAFLSLIAAPLHRLQGPARKVTTSIDLESHNKASLPDSKPRSTPNLKIPNLDGKNSGLQDVALSSRSAKR